MFFLGAFPGSLALQAQTTREDVVELDKLSIAGVRDDDYGASAAPGTTKVALSLLETPQAISVVSRSLLDAQGTHKLEQALRNVAGVTAGGYFGEWDYYRIRGFDVSYSGTYFDGLKGDASPGEETWGLERIEVMKGPASTLFGSGSPGGFVNLVSKRPGKQRAGELQFTIGSWGEREAAIDVNTPLNTAGTVYGRFNGLYRTSDSFTDFAGSSRLYLAPSLTWEITPDTTLTLLTSYRDDKMDLAFALPASGTVLPNPNGQIRHDLYIGDPSRGNDDYETTTRLGYELRHRFNSQLSLRQNVRWYNNDFSSDDLSYPDYPESMEDDRTLRLSGYRATGRFDGWRADTGLDAVFNTGAVRHTLTAGVDYQRSNILYDSEYSDPVYFDVYAPDYATFPAYNYSSGDIYTEKSSALGFYVQDYLKISNRAALTAGLRYDHATLEGDPDKLTDHATTSRLGATYEVKPGTVLYANYSGSFNPQWFFTGGPGGEHLPAETGRNYEVGVKTSLPDGRITTTFALFQLTRRNVATPDLTTPDPLDFTVSGEQRSRGLEIESSLRLTAAWQITAAYSYIDAEVTADNDLPVGGPLLGVAKHTYNIWSKYAFPSGALKNFGFGLGVHGYSRQSGDLYHTFELPGYTLVDAALYYTRGAFSVQLNVDNVFDREFYSGSYDYLYVLPGEPLRARVTVGWKF